MAKIIDGKKIAAELELKLKKEVENFIAFSDTKPSLAILSTGLEPSSDIYIKNITKKAQKNGFFVNIINIGKNHTQQDILNLLQSLNSNSDIHGIMIQMPLGANVDIAKISNKISPLKDIDGINPVNIGCLAQNIPALYPCTAQSIIEILKHEKIPLEGKNAVVIGRSSIVGKPVALMLLNENSTVTVCHSRTPLSELKAACLNADILIAAAGSPGLIKGDYIKKNAVVIDAGINLSNNGIIQGDVSFEEAFPKTSAITPVPGGTGPVTVMMLLRNLLTSAQNIYFSKNNEGSER